MKKSNTTKRTPLEQKESQLQNQPQFKPVNGNASKAYKQVKKLTRDIASIAYLGEAYILCESEMYTIDMDDPAGTGEKRPVLVIDCHDDDRGIDYTLVCNSVIASSFNQLKEPLTGKLFHLRNCEIAPGKRYRKVEVSLVERAE